MIGKLTGTLLEKNPPEVLLDCHGVGYEVNVPMSTFYNLPAVGERVSLLTQFIVREDAQLLYGFGTAQERQAFRELIKISGVGPRTALVHPELAWVWADLAQAISLQEAGRLVKVPGIGKEDGRTPAAGTQGQARVRTWGLCVARPPAMRRPTSCRHCWLWATTTRKRRRRSRRCRRRWG